MLSHTVLFTSLWPHELLPARLLCPWDSPGETTRVGCHAFFQGIFPTQGSNLGLPHCRQILYWLSRQASSRIVEWVAYPFSRESFWPRNRSGAFCITGRFFTSWATWDIVNEMSHNHIFLWQRNPQRLYTTWVFVIFICGGSQMSLTRELPFHIY